MGQKMTWDEIKERYPSQWVSLVDVDYSDDGTVKSGVVAAAGPDLKIVTQILKERNIESRLFEYTGLVKNFLGFAKWEIENVETD